MSNRDICPECGEEDPDTVAYSHSHGFKEFYCEGCLSNKVGKSFNSFQGTGESFKYTSSLQPVKVKNIKEI